MYGFRMRKSHSSNMIEDLSRGNAFGYRECSIIPLLSWFQLYDYFDMFFDVLSNKISTSMYKNNDKKKKKNNTYGRQNRFKIVQSEYFFANLEKVTNMINCWARGYAANNNCQITFVEQKKYQWITVDASRSVKGVHSKQKFYHSESVETLFNFAQFLYPCTTHIVYWLQMLNHSLILGEFDPTLWQYSIFDQF